jgi:hypothetical protein
MNTLVAALLALTYTAAAAGKARNLPNFRSYLVPLRLRHEGGVATAVVALEVGMAGILGVSALDSSVAPFAGLVSVVFIGGVTIAYAAIISRGGAVECNCFGGGGPSRGELSTVIKPAVIATRNVACTVLSLSLTGAALPADVALGGLVAVVIAAGLTSVERHAG